ncbi:MAG: ComEC family competence protein [Eubacteriales bacterium]|nr:ComEC family competence protein [Eubacteriales bacterium]
MDQTPLLEKTPAAAMQRRPLGPLFHVRPMLLLAAGMLFGLLVGESLSIPLAVAAAFVALLAAVFVVRLRRFLWLAAVFAVMAVGILRVGLIGSGTVPEGGGTVLGRVCEQPELREDGTYRVYLDQAELNKNPISGRLRLYAAFSTLPRYGQVISAEASVQRSDGEYRLNDRYQGVYAVAFGKQTAQIVGDTPMDAYGRLLALRENIGGQVSALFPNAPGEAKGMLLGDVSDIDEDTLIAFRNTGITHLLSVSGLHVSLLAVAFSLLFRRNAWVRFAAVAVFGLFYAAITAFSPPVVRSLIMLLVALLAFPLQRRPDVVSSISAAFVLILLYNPYSLWNAGFQLSFVAVLSMALLTPVFQQPLERLGSSASGLVAASVAVVIGTLPTTCLFFQQAQFLSIVTNLFVIPISSVFLIPAFAGTALSYVWFPLGNGICWIARLALDVILAVAHYGGSLTLEIAAPPGITYLLWLFAMFLGSRLCLHSPAKRAIYSISAFALASLLWVLFHQNIT